jgi:LysR family transcriptional regulator, glycine cleavage system transcriptional activator
MANTHHVMQYSSSDMKTTIPPLHELLAFEAVARHLSFTQAAEELCLTQSAVSRKVMSLEQYLGVALLLRVGKRLALTDTGRAYLTRVSPSLKALGSASVEVLATQGARWSLNLSLLPTFGARWLIPRLAQFQADFPEITLNLVPQLPLSQTDFPLEVDAAIRFGEGVWPRAKSQYICGRELVAVASPSLAHGLGLSHKNALRGTTLLHHIAVPHAWAQWFEQQGWSKQLANAGPRFEQYLLLIQAVYANMGVALLPSEFIQSDLEDGKLVQLGSSAVLNLQQGYYICWPEERQDLPALQGFCRWLRKQSKS